MLETIGIFAIIGLIFWGLYLLGRWSDRVEQRSATKVAKKRTDKYLSGWWLRNSDRSRSSYVWQHAATGFFVVCGVWFVLGLFLGPKAFPGGIFLYLPWRRARYTWDANMAECQLRGLAGPVAAVSAISEVPRASTAPTDPVPTIPEQFFVHLREETKGPYTQAQILSMWDSGVLTADTLYWSEDAQTWLPLRGLIVPDDGKMVSPPLPAQNTSEFSQSHLQPKPVDKPTDSLKWSGGQAAAAVVFLTVIVIIVCFASWRASGPAQDSLAGTLPLSAPPSGNDQHEERVKSSREFAVSLWPELSDPNSLMSKEYARILATDSYRDDDYPFAFAKRAATLLKSQEVPGVASTAPLSPAKVPVPDPAFSGMEQDAVAAIGPHISGTPLTAPEDYQRLQKACQSIATTYFPELAVEKSRLNTEFVNRFKQHKANVDSFFQDPDWPIRLTEESVIALRPASSAGQSSQNLPPADVSAINKVPQIGRPPHNFIAFEHGLATGKSTLTIDNGTEHCAIVKLIHADTNQKEYAFVVLPGQQQPFANLNDGTYRMIVALGDLLVDGEERFDPCLSCFEFQKPMVLRTAEAGNVVTTSDNSITLHAVPNGNVKTSTISKTEFEKY